MTSKELMYLEDSLSLEEQLVTKCNDYAKKVTDPQLKTVLSNMAGQHQQHYNNLLTQLNSGNVK